VRQTKTYTFEEAKKALEYYCVYQERCHQEIEGKLSKMILIPEIKEKIITHLISENFLNETRFSKSYARGKFRIKKWGKQRIIRELKARKITSYNINIALDEIDDDEYLETLETLLQKKLHTTNEENAFKKKHKIANTLTRQGYETDLIFELLASYLP